MFNSCKKLRNYRTAAFFVEVLSLEDLLRCKLLLGNEGRCGCLIRLRALVLPKTAVLPNAQKDRFAGC
jgi:hypothetical protein